MELTARAGLSLVSETLLALAVEESVGRWLHLRTRQRGYEEFDKLHAVVLVQAAGGECVEDVRPLAQDAGLRRLLRRAWPWPLRGLEAVNTDLVQRAVVAQPARRATLDLDATLIESHEREALVHFKGGRGYQPTAVLWAEQDLVVADQFRDGNVPAGSQTVEVTRARWRRCRRRCSSSAPAASRASSHSKALKNPTRSP